jgi:hypothetical protein
MKTWKLSLCRPGISHIVFAIILLLFGHFSWGAVWTDAQVQAAVATHPFPRPGCPLCKAARDEFNKHREIIVARPWQVDSLRTLSADVGGVNDTLFLLDRTTAPAAGLAILQAGAKSMTVYHDLPNNFDEARTIHGEAAAYAAGAEYIATLGNSRGGIGSAGGGNVQRVDLTQLSLRTNTVAEQLRTMVAADRFAGVFSVVFGHVSRGRLRLHDGSSIAIKELQGCWVIACDTAKLLFARDPGLGIGIDGTISYEDAIELTNTIVDEVIVKKRSKRDALLRIQKSKGPATGWVQADVMMLGNAVHFA